MWTNSIEIHVTRNKEYKANLQLQDCPQQEVTRNRHRYSLLQLKRISSALLKLWQSLTTRTLHLRTQKSSQMMMKSSVVKPPIPASWQWTQHLTYVLCG